MLRDRPFSYHITALYLPFSKSILYKIPIRTYVPELPPTFIELHSAHVKAGVFSPVYDKEYTKR
jgi:hypothetical protein